MRGNRGRGAKGRGTRCRVARDEGSRWSRDEVSRSGEAMVSDY